MMNHPPQVRGVSQGGGLIVPPRFVQAQIEFDRLVARLEAAFTCTREDAERTVNRIFAAGAQTTSPWHAPFVFFELVLADHMKAGPRLENILREIESPRTTEIFEQHLASRRRHAAGTRT